MYTRKNLKKRKQKKNNKNHTKKQLGGASFIDLLVNLKNKGQNMVNKAQQSVNMLSGQKPIINTSSSENTNETALDKFNKAQESIRNNPNVYSYDNSSSMNGGKYKKKSKKNKSKSKNKK